jgi:hypothetical protein
VALLRAVGVVVNDDDDLAELGDDDFADVISRDINWSTGCRFGVIGDDISAYRSNVRGDGCMEGAGSP